MRHASVWLTSLIVAGCYNPQPQPGSRCADGRCPAGLVCSPLTDTCEREARELDAALVDTSTEASADGPLQLVPCLRDDFNDGTASDWLTPEGTWSIAATGGPDGTPAWSAAMQGSSTTHPSIRGVRAATVSVDFRMDAPASGDFFIRLYEGSWITDPANGRRYTVALFADGSDNAIDRIALTLPPAAAVDLTSRPTTVTPLVWHRLEVVYDFDRSIRASVDGAQYMQIGPHTTLAPPFDIAFRFWGAGLIDNVSVDCAR